MKSQLMVKKIHHVCALILATALVMLILPVASVPSLAASDSSYVLKTITDHLETEDTVKTYEVVLPKAGKVSMNFSHSYFDDVATHWKITMVDGIDKTLLEIESTGKTTSLDSINNYLGAGTYYIRVQSGGWPFFNSGDYTLTINTEASASFTIIAIADTGGSVNGGGTYEEDSSVTLTATPNSGYTFDGWYENNVKISGEGAIYTFTATTDRTLEARFSKAPIEKNPFSDIKSGDWFYDAIIFCYDNNLMTGTDTDTFSPNSNLTRAQVATVLFRIDGEPQTTYSSIFSDVPSGQWYSKAIIWANNNNIVSGYGDGRFGTNVDITREQFATMMYRYAIHKGYDTSRSANLLVYSDVGSISSWAQDALSWCVAEGLISGTSTTTLSPGGNATRAQCATILMRFTNNIVR